MPLKLRCPTTTLRLGLPSCAPCTAVSCRRSTKLACKSPPALSLSLTSMVSTKRCNCYKRLGSRCRTETATAIPLRQSLLGHPVRSQIAIAFWELTPPVRLWRPPFENLSNHRFNLKSRLIHCIPFP